MSSLKNEHYNGSGRQLIPYTLGQTFVCYALSNEKGTRSFLDDWMDNPRSEEKAKRLLSTVLKISMNGLGWATSTRKIHRIAPELYEIKNFAGAARVMAHIHIADKIVVLRQFQGHSGTDKIPVTIITSAARQQQLVVELLEVEEQNGN